MILVRLAIGRRSCAAFSNSTWPVSRSSRIAAGATGVGRPIVREAAVVGPTMLQPPRPRASPRPHAAARMDGARQP